MSAVVVTGTGALSAVCADPADLWQAMTERREPVPESAPGIGPECGPGLWRRIADPLLDRAREELPSAGRSTHAAWAAVSQAVAQAGLTDADAVRMAVIVAGGVGDVEQAERWRGGEAAPADWPPTHRSAAVIADRLGARQSALDLSNACAGGAYAIALGAGMIADGTADVVVAAGVETASRLITASFNRLGALDPEGCRPFDRNRAGTSLAEGAGAVVLESAERARGRGVPVLGVVAGHGWTCDAHHATAPDPSGERITAAMRRALERADVRADDVGVVVPHATGTPLSDVTESTALGAVLGSRLGGVPVYSTKAALGHTGAASGLLSAVAAMAVLRHGIVPPNIAVKELDPDCPVWVPSEEVAVRGSHALVNAFAFGGHNICLVLAPAEDRP